MTPEHKKRDSFFAHRYVRLLSKSCAVMDIGPVACLMCCYIVHQEDSIRYAAPVKFWNQQLMNIMGFTSPKQLESARSKAVAAGWLVYVRGGNRQVGQYYCTIPEHVNELSDSVIEDIHSQNGTNSGMNSGTIPGMNNGTNSGKHSIPVPIPVPNNYSPADFAGSEIKIPNSIAPDEVEQIKDALNRYDIRLREIPASKPFRGNDVTIQSFWNTAARHGAEAFCDAVEQAIQGGWLNLRITSPAAQRGRRKATEFSVEQEAEWVKITAACRMLGEKGDRARNALGPETCRIMMQIGGSQAVRETKPGDFQENELKKRFFATRESERKLQLEGASA